MKNSNESVPDVAMQIAGPFPCPTEIVESWDREDPPTHFYRAVFWVRAEDSPVRDVQIFFSPDPTGGNLLRRAVNVFDRTKEESPSVAQQVQALFDAWEIMLEQDRVPVGRTILASTIGDDAF